MQVGTSLPWIFMKVNIANWKKLNNVYKAFFFQTIPRGVIVTLPKTVLQQIPNWYKSNEKQKYGKNEKLKLTQKFIIIILENVVFYLCFNFQELNNNCCRTKIQDIIDHLFISLFLIVSAWFILLYQSGLCSKTVTITPLVTVRLFHIDTSIDTS